MGGKLAGKVVLVTGASRGIGQGLAVGLAAAGARVAVNYKSDAGGAETTCRRVRQAGGIPDIPETQGYVRTVMGHYRTLGGQA